MLLDSTILIDYLRGLPDAKIFLHAKSNKNISLITKLEVISGLKTKKEIAQFEKLLQFYQIETLSLTKNISQLAEDIFKKNYHSHSIGIADALIAATALSIHQVLFTHNLKHFLAIKKLKTKKPY